MTQRPKIFCLLAALLSLFFPTLVSAHDFLPSSRGSVFVSSAHVYRLRSVNKPWQLSAFTGGTVRQSIEYDNQVYIVAGDGSQKLFRSRDGLTIEQITSVGEGDMSLTVVGGRLFAYQQNGQKLFVSSNETFTPVSPAVVGSSADLERLVSFLGETQFLRQSSNSVIVYNLENNQWLQTSQFNCPASRVFAQPFIFVACADGTIFTPISAESYQQATLPPLVGVQASDQLLLGQDPVNPLIVLVHANETLYTINLTLGPSDTLIGLRVLGARIIVSLSSGQYELLWRLATPQLVTIGPASGAVIAPPDGETLFYSGTQPQISPNPGEWSPITTAGAFNHVAVSPRGHFIWQTSGSTGGLAQFAQFGSTNFVKVNPWSSTTSPVFGTSLGEIGYASVVTSSGTGNVNLYKSTDYISWSRITLPSQPTVVASISATRTLLAGSFVETTGVLSVLPGVVDNQALYIQDTQAGIQVFLSSTLGNLPQQLNKLVRVTGEISTSQVKRLTLDFSDDLEILGNGTVEHPSLNSDDASGHVGRTAKLKGSIESLVTDAFSLQGATKTLKVHFDQAKAKFQTHDELVVPVIIDWSASSGAVEAWSLDGSSELLSRRNSVSTGLAATKSSAKVSSSKTATSSAAPTSGLASKAVSAKSVVAPATFRTSPTDTTAVAKNNLNYPLILAGFVTGLLLMRGRRLTFLADMPT